MNNSNGKSFLFSQPNKHLLTLNLKNYFISCILKPQLWPMSKTTYGHLVNIYRKERSKKDIQRSSDYKETIYILYI